jgi:hypothetical protein
MAELLLEENGLPKPQYENDGGTGFEAQKGKEGASYSYIKDGHNVTLGTKADGEASEGSGSVVSLLKNLRTRLGALQTIFDGTKKIGNVDVNNFPVTGAKIGSLVGKVTVAATATELKVGGAALANRKAVVVFNNAAADIFVGYTNAVTTATGFPIKAGTERRFDVNPTEVVTLFAIAAADSDVRIQEIL